MKQFDIVQRPEHYAPESVECIEAIKASMSKEQFCGYLKGNIVKYLTEYLWRHEHKGNPLEDLNKAKWYLEKLIGEKQ